MDDEPPPDAATGAAKADGSSSAAQQDHEVRADVVVIAPGGAVVLDVLFEGLLPPVSSAPAAGAMAAAQHNRHRHRRRRLVVPFRVDAAALVKHSRYFANLLDNTRFQEARAVKAALEALAQEGVDPADEAADAGSRLPRVRIEVACESGATARVRARARAKDRARPRVQVAGAGKGRATTPAVARRDQVFAELLRVLHWDGDSAKESGGDGDRGQQTATATRKPSLPPKAPAKKGLRAKKKGAVTGNAATQPPTSEAAPVLVPPPPLLPGSRWSTTTPPTLAELAELALLADRFACTEAVAVFVRTLRVRNQQGARGTVAVAEGEESLRQKVYVAWLLDQPLRFHTATRALVLAGSQRWACAGDDDDDNDDDDFNDGCGSAGEPDGGYGLEDVAPWWDLPDNLEQELQFRRQCIVDCIASVPRHFLARYARRSGGGGGNGPLQKDGNGGGSQLQRRHRLQCTMGYESSAACDSFQLGEMVKFLTSRGLLSFQDFAFLFSASPSASRPPAAASFAHAGDLHSHLLAPLRQCPAYQLDKHHVNCGLRPRLMPVLDFLEVMLAASAIGLHRHEWAATGHGQASWLAAAESMLPTDSGEDDDGDDDDDEDGFSGQHGYGNYGNYGRVPVFRKPRPSNAVPSSNGFRFTRSMAGDQRLRIMGNLGADRIARQLFTARKWNWTPEH